MKIKALFSSIRGPFLILTPVCVFLGAVTAVEDQTTIDIYLLFIALLGALLAHISVNAMNEYFDFKSGLDLITTRTKFSGGSGSLPQSPEMASAVLLLGVIASVFTFLIGLFFVWKSGPGIIPIGVVGLLLMVTYTGWINKHPIICLLAPGIGFGFLMVVGTQYVLTGEFNILSWVIAIFPFFLVNNLLLLNQYPDIHADMKVGRNHLPIAYGTGFANKIYAIFIASSIVVLLIGIALGYLPLLSLIALLPMPLAFFALSGAMKHGDAIGESPKYLAANVAVTLLAPFLLGLSILLS